MGIVLRTCVSLVILMIGLPACAVNQPLTSPLPYRDDFSDPQSGWQTLSDVSADVMYDNGRLRFVVKQENLTQWSVAGRQFADGDFEVEAQATAGPTDNGFGVIFRFQDRKNFYHFEISSDGYWRAGIVKDGNWENWSDWTAHPAIQTGNAVNRIRVIMQGDRFVFMVNDQLVAQHQDSSFAYGDIGLFALSLIDAPGVDVSFDNVSVKEVADNQ
ncbi:MAG: DUF1080 domain-containing protein [Anaerolineae bacterium]|nr:DUF1080 domain-containing protein [Thermoflexales bacterium]MDW8408161.1 DUF1080 domain-containing protein [Anaerolineae bacterium]